MKIKTSDLIGAALDWAVCNAGGGAKDIRIWRSGYWDYNMYHYSADWSQGGPIIDHFRPSFIQSFSDRVTVQKIDGEGFNFVQHGPALLIAAMRCYVASRLGEEVEIPEELT